MYENISYDEIESKIMCILLANEGKVYDQYNLYSLLVDKFNIKYNNFSNYIPYDFKCKYLIVLKQLMSNNDIKIIKNLQVYYAVYNPSENIQSKDIEYNKYWIKKCEFNDYIVNNKIPFDYKDLESGNSIYHDIFMDGNCETIKKIIKENNFDYEIKNNADKTPIECINEIEPLTIILNDLIIKQKEMKKEINELKNKLEISNYSLTTFLKIKFYKYFDKFYIIQIFLLILILIITFIINKIIN